MANLARRLIRWCFTSRTDPDEGPFPTQQISYMGKATDSVAWFPYGFHAVARLDALGLMLNQNGDTHVHLPGSPRDRILLEDGEVIVYHPVNKSKVHFKANGDIDIDAPETDVNIAAAGDVNITSGDATNITVAGNCTLDVEGNLRTKCGSTRLQNDAGSDDLHLTVSDLLEVFDTFGVHNSSFRATMRAVQARVDALR